MGPALKEKLGYVPPLFRADPGCRGTGDRVHYVRFGEGLDPATGIKGSYEIGRASHSHRIDRDDGPDWRDCVKQARSKGLTEVDYEELAV